MDFTFAELLQSFRKRASLKQVELANALSLSRNTISAWERALYLPEHRELILRLAEELTLSQAETDQLLRTASFPLEYGIDEPLKALHQLRPPVADFVGRAAEVENLATALGAALVQGGAAVISGVRGMGGIGKTELAYKAAQQLCELFPDAQLLIELEGSSTSPLTPEQALQAVLRAFARERKLPDELSELQGLYRSLLSGKRVLILADDARDETVVQPLLPPSGSALLITSRNRFHLPGMTTLDLGLLSPEEAKHLLLRICPRIGMHAAELGLLCGSLPLALRVSASLLEVNDTRDVASYLNDLHAARLNHLSDPEHPDDPQASVEVSLRLSYAVLPPAAQSVLCQISVFPASFDREAAQAVVAADQAVEGLLELLRRRSLVEWDANAQRYDLHDLVRAFGAARLTDADAVRSRHARHYMQVAAQAERLYREGGAGVLAGLALFDQERAHIDAGRRWAVLHAGTREDDRLLLDDATATVSIGVLRYDARRERIPQWERALAAAQQLGDQHAEAQALRRLGVIYEDLGEGRRAIGYSEQALTIYRALGDRRGEGISLSNLGNTYTDLNEARRAIELCTVAVTIARDLGDRRLESYALSYLARAQVPQGDLARATIAFEQALALFRAVGDRWGEAQCNWQLGLILEQQGEPERAAELMQVCVDYEREIGHTDAEAHAAQLAQLRERLAGKS